MRQDFSAVYPQELSALFPVLLQPHNPVFAAQYRRERLFLQSVFGDAVVRISHVGSTSVPGILAKPTLDILLELVPDIDLTPFTEQLLDEGYVVNTPPMDRIMYLKGYTPQGFSGEVVHIHVRTPGDWGELYFRDYLCEHPQTAHAYEALKRKLCEQYPNDRDAYTLAKGKFVLAVTDRARAAYPNRYARLPQKTLYISDLDGTLLQPDATLSEETRGTLQALLGEGMFFTVATARTEATVCSILQGLPLPVPAVLQNGVALCDIAARRHLQVHTLPRDTVEVLLRTIGECCLSGFLYCMERDCLQTYYENTDSPNAAAFIAERERKYKKKFTLVPSFAVCAEKEIIYYSISDRAEKLAPAQKILSGCPSLHVEYYRDIYAQDCWYLEVSSAQASKQKAVEMLREMYAFTHVVGFGDNLNDLPLFAACDEAYAVVNAREEVKNAADGVLAANTENGVARFLQERWKTAAAGRNKS